jgi:multicomponent Na+:H+ antiporter subunit E
MTPAIVAIPLDIDSDGEITLLANMITLTPGTLSLDVSDDRRFLYVHGMHIKDIEAFKQEIKGGFEVIVREVLE